MRANYSHFYCDSLYGSSVLLSYAKIPNIYFKTFSHRSSYLDITFFKKKKKKNSSVNDTFLWLSVRYKFDLPNKMPVFLLFQFSRFLF